MSQELKYYRLIVHTINKGETRDLEKYLKKFISDFGVSRNGYTRAMYTFGEPLSFEQVTEITRKIFGKVRRWTFKI